MPTWQEHSEESLISYVAGQDIKFQAAAGLEMQRRLLVAVREARVAADKATVQTNTLNQRMFALTFAVGLLTFVQACTAVTEFVTRAR